jgi:hypothetical protein
MARLFSIMLWLGSSRARRRREPQQRSFRPTLEGMEDRLLLSSAPVLSGDWFVQNDGGLATISQNGNQLTLTNENSTQTVGQMLSPTSFQAWGQTAQVVQDGNLTEILWRGNAWIQSTWMNSGLGGQWFVENNNMSASISQTNNQLVLTNEDGSQTVAQWTSPTTFTAWGQTATVVQQGALTVVLWPGNSWVQSSWQNGGLAGQFYVQSDGLVASVSESNGQLTLTNEQGTQTTGQWLSPTSFTAWGQIALVVQNGALTQIVWNGNSWTQSSWENGGLSGTWFVKSNGETATITQSGDQITLTNDQGVQTAGTWLSPTSFSAWGQTAHIVQSGTTTEIEWNGDVWSQSTWQQGGLAGEWFVQSNGMPAFIDQTGGQLSLVNEKGTQTVGQWLSPTSFSAWGQTATIEQNGNTIQILWAGNSWNQSAYMNGGLSGAWTVQNNGLAASVIQTGNVLVLVNEQGTVTTAQWLSPTSFEAWGQAAQVVPDGGTTEITWSGNAWTQTSPEGTGLGGQWLVQSNGQAATIVQVANQLLLTNENGTQTVGQWTTPTTFRAWGQTATVVQQGPLTVVLWPGNAWTESLVS